MNALKRINVPLKTFKNTKNISLFKKNVKLFSTRNFILLSYKSSMNFLLEE